MLVLSRKQGESIVFEEVGVVVEVTDLRRSKVQLGIRAPREITVSRSERPRPRKSQSDMEAAEESRRLAELARVKTLIAALAEMADPQHRNAASEAAADANQRLSGIERSLRLATLSRAAESADPSQQPDQPPQRTGEASIAELVTIRSEVIEHLRSESEPDSKEGSVGTTTCCHGSETASMHATRNIDSERGAHRGGNTPGGTGVAERQSAESLTYDESRLGHPHEVSIDVRSHYPLAPQRWRPPTDLR